MSLKNREDSIFPTFIGILVVLIFGLGVTSLGHLFFIYIDWPVSRYINSHIWVFFIYIGLMQSVCEESGRLIAFNTVLRDYEEPETSLYFGLGHGGAEMLFFLATYILNGTSFSMLAVSVYERVIMFFSQIALSVLIFAAARNRRFRLLFPFAIVVHAGINVFSSAVNNLQTNFSVLAIQLTYTATAILLVLFAFYILHKLSLPKQDEGI